MNTYGYVDGNPVNSIDPNGLRFIGVPRNATEAAEMYPGTNSQNYISRVLQGEVAMQGLNRYAKILNGVASGDVLAREEFANEFMGMGVGGVTKLIKSCKAIKGAGSQIRRTKISDLIPTELPAMSRRESALLEKSIRNEGIRDPIKIVVQDGKNYIVQGNNRLRVARKLGIQDVLTQEVQLPFRGFMNPDDLIGNF